MFLYLFWKLFSSAALLDLRAGGSEVERERGGSKTGLSFCLIVNPLLDKQEFTLSVRMKHKRALLPRTGVVGD